MEVMINNIKTVINVIKELNYILSKSQKEKAIFVFVVILFSAGFELLGVSTILPFVQAIMSPEVLSKNKHIQSVFNMFGINTNTNAVIIFGGVIIAVYLLKNIFMIFSSYVQADYSTKVQKSLAVTMLNSYMSQPYTFFMRINSAEILRGCQNDIVASFEVIQRLLSLLAEGFTVLVIGIYIVYMDLFIASTVIFLMTMVLILMIFYFKPLVKRAGNKRINVLTQKNKTITQAVSGIKDILVKRRNQQFIKEFESAAEEERKVQRLFTVLSECPDRIVEGVCVSGIMGVVCIRMMMAPNEMASFIPKLATFAMAAFRILPSIGKITNRMNGIVFNRPGLHNVYLNFKAANEYQNELRCIQEPSICDDIDFKFNLCIRDVDWKYGESKPFVLHGTTLEIIKGQSVALIGASGAGKTTLADVILGLLPPQGGSVLMDGMDIYSIPEAWSRIIGYVPQGVYLVDDTIRNNVRFGYTDGQNDDEKIWKALEQAQLSDFVRSLPYQLDTIVGERGVRFSGGQRQRIAIARALYSDPEILVLDEATSALDNETETAVMEAIDSLQGKITMIIVAHRLTTIKNCDKIYEIIDGKAIERSKNDVLQGVV